MSLKSSGGIPVGGTAAVSGFTVSGYTDNSGAPGNTTINAARGRAAIAATATACVVTNSKVTATSGVFVQLRSNDTVLTSVSVVTAAGSFTVTGNGAANAAVPFDFVVFS
jgi:hypothetical protein